MEIIRVIYTLIDSVSKGNFYNLITELMNSYPEYIEHIYEASYPHIDMDIRGCDENKVKAEIQKLIFDKSRRVINFKIKLNEKKSLSYLKKGMILIIITNDNGKIIKYERKKKDDIQKIVIPIEKIENLIDELQLKDCVEISKEKAKSFF